MKMKAQKSIVLKRNFKNLKTILLPMAKKVISNQINKIKSRIMCKIRPNKVQNTPKRVSNRGIKSLENINTPKIVNEKTPIDTKPKIAKPENVDKPPIATKPKIVIEKTPIASKPKTDDKPEIATKPKIAIKPKNANKNYEYKNRVIKQLKKHFKKLFDAKKK